MKIKFLFFICLTLLLGAGCMNTSGVDHPPNENEQQTETNDAQGENKEQENTDEASIDRKKIHFSHFDPVYRFAATIPESWEVAYVPEIQSINIFDPASSGNTPLEQSQIFIRTFTANKFLTLSTVDILGQEETSVHGHEAVRYRIEKKPGVADFSHQPHWRNEEHKLIDVRLQSQGESQFYVFAYNPQMPEDDFMAFIDSLQFDNDASTFETPIDRASERVTKKPFGIHVTPEDSPVSPERFRGYHTGVDFEAFEDEKDVKVPVRAFCSGTIRQVRRVSGYGGLIIQDCLLDHEPITVLYGHVTSCQQLSECALDKAGEYVTAGETIAVLGRGESSETDGERKHLHFSVLKGTQNEIRGYVQQERNLEYWMDPLKAFSSVFTQ